MPSALRRQASWLAPIALAIYIPYATYDWRLPDKNGQSFAPIWMALVVVAALVMWRRVGHLTPIALTAIMAVAGMVLTDITLFWSPALRDIHLDLKAAHRYLDGQPVYIRSVLLTRPPDPTDLPFVYPPLTLPFFALLARLPEWLALVAWVGASLAAALWSLRRFGLEWGWALLFLLWPPFSQGLYVGNVVVPLLVLFALPYAGRTGAGLVPTAIFKLYSGLSASWLVRERRWRDLALGVTVVMGLIVLTLPLVGLTLWGDWAEGLRLYQASLTNIPASLLAMGLIAFVPAIVAAGVALAAVTFALVPRGRICLERLGLATVIASPSLFAHGFIVATPAFLRLRAAPRWVALGITSVAPGLGWWLAIGLVAASWFVAATRVPDDAPIDPAEGLLTPRPRPRSVNP
jgi:hypothetical protein